ncbi:MAG: TlpA family protein disulfide reductase [Myxococcales bacterium]|jgi:hypothetical protein|nr:TlpA family protein disulfide reductase [Myxococcales bacterium]
MGRDRGSGRGVVLALCLVGCGASTGEAAGPVDPAPVQRGAPVSYAWGTTDGRVVSSEELRGRATVLLFVTTFDLASQAEAKHLEDLYRTHKPRINAVAVVMEAPKYAPLARSFAEVLGLSYPVALADDATRQGRGPFGVISSVPSWVILDRDARPVFAHAGVVSLRQIERGLRSVQR